jgi:hypothetical protein
MFANTIPTARAGRRLRVVRAVTPAPWSGSDPRSRQRDRWRVLARAEAEAASRVGESHIAAAFAIVLATVELDHLPEPPTNGRETLKGRAEVRARAVTLAETGLSARSVARVVGQPYGTVYAWLRRAGVAQTRDQWRRSFEAEDPERGD